MFGRPPAAPQKDWNEMYFHQKAVHIADHVADWMFAKSKYWMPAIGVSMAASLLLLSGPMAIPEGAQMVMPLLMPVSGAPVFGNQMPEHEGQMPQGEDEEEEF
jgi:hypothetical protein